MIPILSKIKGLLYRKYLLYEKYIVWQASTLLFCACTMELSKKIFNIYLPVISWSIFLETVGLAGVLISALGVWLAWSSERRAITARKEEKKFIALERCEEKQMLQEATLQRLREEILIMRQNFDESKSEIGRLTAQVEQIETETILKRKIACLEERFSELQKMNYRDQLLRVIDAGEPAKDEE